MNWSHFIKNVFTSRRSSGNMGTPSSLVRFAPKNYRPLIARLDRKNFRRFALKNW